MMPLNLPRLATRLAALAAVLAAAPAASAATYQVNSVADTNDGVCDLADCTLRDAIQASNGSVGEADVISFDIAGAPPYTFNVASSLPALNDQVTIDGGTEPDFNGVDPVVALIGPGQGSGVTGITIEASAVTIQGLAIGGFDAGILIGGGGANSIGLNRIGTDVTGTVAIPNGFGIFIGAGANSNVIAFNGLPNLISGNTTGLQVESEGNLISENRIGTNAAGTAAVPNGTGIFITGSSNAVGSGQNSMRPNVISGNSTTGVRIESGSGNVVDSNLIGTDASGQGPLGNGAFGVEVVSGGENLVGGFSGSPAPGNLIAFNGLAGVRVIQGGRAYISQNSIYLNGSSGRFGLGIDIGALGLTPRGEGSQNFPEITAAVTTVTGVRVSGRLDSFGMGEHRLEFFASPDCDDSGHGEGFRYLGHIVGQTDAAGALEFDDELLVPVRDGEAITSTATGPAGFTSEFSRCALATAAPVPPPGAAPLPAPVPGSRVNVAPVRGVVRVRLPGGRFRVLVAGQQVPVGSVLDTTRGTVRLTSAANRRGATQTANFRDGVFKTLQRKSAGAFTELKLTGPLKGCRARGGRAAATRRGRRLWGSGKGRFRSVGNRASAGVRGTRWLVEDRCDKSTLVLVKQGRVTVRDFVRRKTIRLRAGQRYVARPRTRP